MCNKFQIKHIYSILKPHSVGLVVFMLRTAMTTFFISALTLAHFSFEATLIGLTEQSITNSNLNLKDHLIHSLSLHAAIVVIGIAFLIIGAFPFVLKLNKDQQIAFEKYIKLFTRADNNSEKAYHIMFRRWVFLPIAAIFNQVTFEKNDTLAIIIGVTLGIFANLFSSADILPPILALITEGNVVLGFTVFICFMIRILFSALIVYASYRTLLPLRSAKS